MVPHFSNIGLNERILRKTAFADSHLSKFCQRLAENDSEPEVMGSRREEFEILGWQTNSSGSAIVTEISAYLGESHHSFGKGAYFMTSCRSLAILTLSAIGSAILSAAQNDVVTRVLSESKADFYSARTTYVQFSSPTATKALAARWNRETARRGFDAFLQSTKSYFSDPYTRRQIQENGGKPNAAHSYQSKTILSIVEPSLVSLFIDRTVYSGGAHANSQSDCATFGLIGGRAVRLKITDVLHSSDLTSDIKELVMPGLMAKKHSRMPDAEEPIIGKEWMTNWFVSPNGLTWIFEQGVIGAEAEGRFVVKVPWDRLNELIRSDGPLRKFRITSPEIVGAWEMVRFVGMDDSQVEIKKPKDFSLNFMANGTFTGKVDINRIQGTYKRQGSSLSMKVETSTKAMPPPGSYHDKFLANLGYVRSMTLQNGKLFLALMADGGIMEFRRSMLPSRS